MSAGPHPSTTPLRGYAQDEWGRRFVVGLLIFIAVWPIVPLVLQLRFGVDPWKLMSFGMYAAPGRRVEDLEVTLLRLEAGEWKPVDGGDALQRFRARRRTLGQLATPDDLLAAQPGPAKLEIRTRFLDPATARVATRLETYLTNVTE